ncbi:hypothetical protein JW865_01075 [Candidatus Bathyarchaeota archaeon]|nr:hypothetical protein [Candidatus Bathyarchaeota archaeon]
MASKLLKQKWVPPFLLIGSISVLLVIWYITFPKSSWEQTPNYFLIYFNFIFTRPTDAFLTLNTGPGAKIAWVFLPTYLLIILHFFLHNYSVKAGKTITIVNKNYLIILAILGLGVISIQNCAQYYDWYWNPQLNAPGYVDTWTHILSPTLLGALIAPFALERYFGWNRDNGWFIVFGILTMVALIWEIGETIDVYINPSASYYNFPIDSIKDVIMGAIVGSIISTWLYEKIVVDPLD